MIPSPCNVPLPPLEYYKVIGRGGVEFGFAQVTGKRFCINF